MSGAHVSPLDARTTPGRTALDRSCKLAKLQHDTSKRMSSEQLLEHIIRRWSHKPVQYLIRILLHLSKKCKTFSLMMIWRRMNAQVRLLLMA